MTAYAVGDIQGCYSDFRRLLEKINFDPGEDRLFLVGDIVNRGPESLATLRFIKQLGSTLQMVLGNHDLHLIRRYWGITNASKGDTLEEILNAHDCDELIDWLRRQPFFHHDTERNFCLVHAGVPPQWDLITANTWAKELSDGMVRDDYSIWLESISNAQPQRSEDVWGNLNQQRYALDCLTRLRFVDEHGQPDYREKGPPGKPGLIPWFDYPNPKWHGTRLVFGHWAALGVHLSAHAVALDSGCVWGGELTAVNLDFDFELQCVSCKSQKPLE